jgi:hypothetical protein
MMVMMITIIGIYVARFPRTDVRLHVLVSFPRRSK